MQFTEIENLKNTWKSMLTDVEQNYIKILEDRHEIEENLENTINNTTLSKSVKIYKEADVELSTLSKITRFSLHKLKCSKQYEIFIPEGFPAMLVDEGIYLNPRTNIKLIANVTQEQDILLKCSVEDGKFDLSLKQDLTNLYNVPRNYEI